MGLFSSQVKPKGNGITEIGLVFDHHLTHALILVMPLPWALPLVHKHTYKLIILSLQVLLTFVPISSCGMGE